MRFYLTSAWPWFLCWGSSLARRNNGTAMTRLEQLLEEFDTHDAALARVAVLEAACSIALTAYNRVSRIRLPGDVAGDLVHARETLRAALLNVPDQE